MATVATRLIKIAFGMFSRGFSTSSVTVAMRSYPSKAMNVRPIAFNIATEESSFAKNGSKLLPSTAKAPNPAKTSRMMILMMVTTVSAPPLASVETALSRAKRPTTVRAYRMCHTGPVGSPAQYRWTNSTKLEENPSA